MIIKQVCAKVFTSEKAHKDGRSSRNPARVVGKYHDSQYILFLEAQQEATAARASRAGSGWFLGHACGGDGEASASGNHLFSLCLSSFCVLILMSRKTLKEKWNRQIIA